MKRTNTHHGRPKASIIAATVNGWATSIGQEPRTLEKKLVRAGLKLRPGARLSAAEVIGAIVGDGASLRNENLRLRNEQLTLKNAVADRTFIHKDEMDWLFTHAFRPVREFALSFGATYSPALAGVLQTKHGVAEGSVVQTLREFLDNMAEEFLRNIRESKIEPWPNAAPDAKEPEATEGDAHETAEEKASE